MRKLLITSLLIVTSQFGLFAQDSGITLEMHYPIMIADQNNYASEISGLFGASLQFQISDNDSFNYGVKYTFDQIQTQQSYINSSDIKRYNFMMSHIDGFGLIDLNTQKNLKAVLETGMSFYKYRKSTTQPGYLGFNVGTGLNYEFENRFYAFAHYNYIQTSLKEKQTGFVNKEKIQAFRIGFGLKF